MWRAECRAGELLAEMKERGERQKAGDNPQGRNCCTGNPEPRHISTSFVERQNLTMRMSMRRFTRLSNGFSKKAENHAHSVAIHFMHYNFVRIHQSLRVTPAMAAGVTNTLWSLTDMVRVIEDWEARRSQCLADRLVG